MDHVDNKDLWNKAVNDRLRPHRWAAGRIPAGLRMAGSALGAVLTVTALQAAFSGPASAAPVPPATTAATAGPVAAAEPVAAAGLVARHWGSFFGNTNGDVTTHWWPATVHLPGQIAQVASSNSTEYALLTNGSLYTWGLGSQGELGDGGTGNSFEKPVRVRFPAGVKIASLPADAMPYDTGLALDTRGRAWGWGKNAGGSLCLGTTRMYLTPVELPLRDVTTLAGASTHTLFDAGGTVYSCGANLSGDLGDGTKAGSTTPVKVAGLDGRAVVQLVATAAWPPARPPPTPSQPQERSTPGASATSGNRATEVPPPPSPPSRSPPGRSESPQQRTTSSSTDGRGASSPRSPGPGRGRRPGRCRRRAWKAGALMS